MGPILNIGQGFFKLIYFNFGVYNHAIHCMIKSSFYDTSIIVQYICDIVHYICDIVQYICDIVHDICDIVHYICDIVQYIFDIVQ